MGIFSFIADAVKGFAAYFGWAQKKQELTNSPAMQANAEAAQIQKDKDAAAAAIANPDQTKLNEDVAP